MELHPVGKLVPLTQNEIGRIIVIIRRIYCTGYNKIPALGKWLWWWPGQGCRWWPGQGCRWW